MTMPCKEGSIEVVSNSPCEASHRKELTERQRKSDAVTQEDCLAPHENFSASFSLHCLPYRMVRHIKKKPSVPTPAETALAGPIPMLCMSGSMMADAIAAAR